MNAVDELVAALGPEAVVRDREVLSSYLSDWTGRYHGEALCVARPSSAWQVQKVIEIAGRFRLPIVTQGGNSSLVGGATPAHGGIILSTKRLVGIEVDPLARSATVGSGVTLAELNSAAQSFGLSLGVDLASRDSATLGGMAATNAGGIHVLRHGSMRNQVLGVELVTGRGSIITRMDGLLKDNSGYDWSAIVCGSEGTLAVITRLVVRLVSIPLHRSVALVSVDTLEAAMRLVSDFRIRFSDVNAVEFMSGSSLALVADSHAKAWPMGDFPPYGVLLELAGETVETEAISEFLEKSDEILDGVVAYDFQAAKLWDWRELISVSISSAGIPHKLDITVPLGDMSRFVSRLEAFLGAEYPGAQPVLFGHLGDGNVHVNILGVDAGDEEIDHEVLALAASFGGSIASEHGIGRAKVNDLSLTRTPQDINAMRLVKRALDPQGILNPGILFP